MRNPSNRSFGRTLRCGDRDFVIPDDWHVHYGDAAMCRQALLDGEGIAVDVFFPLIADELISELVVPVLPGWHRLPWSLTVSCPTMLAQDETIQDIMQYIRCITLDSFMDRWPFWYQRFGVSADLVGLPADPRP